MGITSPTFKKTTKFLEGLKRAHFASLLDDLGSSVVSALAAATPVDTGESANSWGYQITEKDNKYKLTITNSDTTPTGTPIVILVQYGHATKNGGYVQGTDFINPVIAPLVDAFNKRVIKEVSR